MKNTGLAEMEVSGMKRVHRFRGGWLALALLLFAAGALAEEAAPHYTLPIDFSPGQPVNTDFFLSETEYEDPTLKVSIHTGLTDNRTEYWYADVEIADASQLRTASADGFDSNAVAPGPLIASRMNAVVAINGDYFSYRGHDFYIRQGIEYKNHLRRTWDILVIDEDGDFHGFKSPTNGEVGTEIDGKKIINGFCFGPLLINGGEKMPRGYDTGMSADTKCQRMAIAQIGPLKYRVVCCAGPRSARAGQGLTLEDFREFLYGMGDIQVAYNLDGGESTMLIINGEKINSPDNPNTRDVADIIYFASAYPAE